MNKISRYFVKCTVLLFLVLLVLVSVFFYLRHNIQQKREFLRLLDITPVPTMKIDNVHIEGAMDYLVRAKITLDHDYIDAFLNNSPFKGRALSSEKEFFSANPPKWWKPNQAEHFLSGEYSDIADGEYYQIYINLDDKRKATVFIQWFEV